VNNSLKLVISTEPVLPTATGPFLKSEVPANALLSEAFFQVPLACVWMSGIGPWLTTPAQTGTGPVTGVLRSSANEWGRRDHIEDWGRHGAHSLPHETQMQHETGKPLHIKGLLRILIPPFPGSNPGAPANQRGLRQVISGWVRSPDISVGGPCHRV